MYVKKNQLSTFVIENRVHVAQNLAPGFNPRFLLEVMIPGRHQIHIIIFFQIRANQIKE